MIMGSVVGSRLCFDMVSSSYFRTAGSVPCAAFSLMVVLR